MWRAHSCVPCSHSCEHTFCLRPQEWGRGTHECVRHRLLQMNDPALNRRRRSLRSVVHA
jgi:hypothetical protein